MDQIICILDIVKVWAFLQTRLFSIHKPIQELFQPIAREYQTLESQSLLEGLELVELTQDTLDEVWKQTEFEPAYLQARMKHLLDVTGNS